jgi:DNA-binding MarR family transcriptional regulator
MFHAAVAAQLGLSVTEEKALDLLHRHGPMTAGELAQRSGLAPASVTGLIDRLASKGFARRIADPDDRRRVRLELDPSLQGRMRPLFTHFVEEMRALCGGYSDGELAAITRFLDEVRALQHEATARLTAPTKPRARRG